jgi:hypothetical protein
VKKYVSDTNIYMRANRDRDWAEQLVAFYWSFLPFTFLHAVVVQELLLGAISPASAKQVHNGYIAPFERRDRIITPSYQAWRRGRRTTHSPQGVEPRQIHALIPQ